MCVSGDDARWGTQGTRRQPDRDNYARHKHRRVQSWLAAHPRVQVPFTPTYASWLNQVEIWFHIITQKAIRHGTFRSVKELVAQIEPVYLDRYG